MKSKLLENNKLYFVYEVPKSFIDLVVKLNGKQDLFFRDIYNYRNLKKNDKFREFNLRFSFTPIYHSFYGSALNRYIECIGEEKFKKCLSDENMNVETLFDEKDIFVNMKDVIDYWNDESTKLPNLDDEEHPCHCFDIEKYLMEDREDCFKPFDECPGISVDEIEKLGLDEFFPNHDEEDPQNCFGDEQHLIEDTHYYIIREDSEGNELLKEEEERIKELLKEEEERNENRKHFLN